MQDIKILELLIALLIFIPLFRPFIKDLQPLDGLVWFFPLALICGISLFPAYGFRPECIPLLIYAGIINIGNIPALVAVLKDMPHTGFYKKSMGRFCITVFFLIITTGIAFYFSPLEDTALNTQQFKTVMVRNEEQHTDFFLHIYGSDDIAPRPVLFLVPPILGSVSVVDKVCGELQSQGFTVITYSRRHFDFPAVGEEGRKYGFSVGTAIRLFQAIAFGTRFEHSNIWGQNLEEERKQDVLFLLSYIRHNAISLGADMNTLFLAGYGEGGSAVVLIGESPQYMKDNPEIKGLIVVESPLWSVYQVEERLPLEPPPEAVQWFKSIWSAVANGFVNLLPKKIIGIQRVPRIEIPVLFIVSHKATQPRFRDNGLYQPLFSIMRSSAPAALVSIEGAGMLDYTDYPVEYPLYSAFSAGIKEIHWKNRTYIQSTASIMTHFAALVIAADVQHERVFSLSPSQRFMENIHFETGRAWNLPHLGYILFP